MNEVFCNVELNLLIEIDRLLVDAHGNSSELLNEHDQSLGRTTKKNKTTAEMYEKEVNDLHVAIGKLREFTNH